MINIRISSLILFVSFFVLTGFSACDSSNDNDPTDVLVSAYTDAALTEAEIANLLFMREEEKLARDVYLYLYDKYEMNIFNNISSSEQTHMDAVLAIMEYYGLADNASAEMGEFSNPSLQQLYDDLIAQGDLSLIEALKVGATIEDVDIRDLRTSIAATDKADLIDLYELLECGSGNHMRAFTRQLDNQGVSYEAQYISQEEYEEVLAGEHVRCGV